MPETFDPVLQAYGVNEVLRRPEPEILNSIDILRAGSYFFYDFQNNVRQFDFTTENDLTYSTLEPTRLYSRYYTKEVSPLFDPQIINNAAYWDLLGIVTEDIPFYHLEPTIEQTISDTYDRIDNDEPVTKTGIDLREHLTLAEFRDSGVVDVPAPLQNSAFWGNWLRDTIGYYINKLILDVYNKLQYPLLNEHLYLNATVFPKLANEAFRNLNPESEIADLRFRDQETATVANDIEDVGTPLYIEELINSRLNSIYSLLDYRPDSAEILENWAESLYEVGLLTGSELSREKTIYRLQDLRHELLKRKFAGTSTLYQLVLRSINRSGSFISAIPASLVGNSKTAYYAFNEKRNIRLVNLPGLTTSIVHASDLPFDVEYEYYTRRVEEGLGREIPLDVLYPLFCSASTTLTYQFIPDSASTEDNYIYSTTVDDSVISGSSYSITGNPLDKLRYSTDTLVWDALEGISFTQSLATVWTTLDEKEYSESEEGVDPNAYIHLDPGYSRDPSTGTVKEILHTLDEQSPYASLQDITGHMFDISADSLMYHENTFQKADASSYKYLTYPITDNLSVSLMDLPWLNYLQNSVSAKSRLQEDIQTGVQVSSFNNIATPQQAEFPFFIWSTGTTEPGATTSRYSLLPASDATSKDIYLWFAILTYDVKDFTVAGIKYYLMSKVSKAGYTQENKGEITSDEVLDNTSEWYQYNVGLMPLTYSYLKDTVIQGFNYDQTTDDYADQEYTKAYYIFSNGGAQAGKRATDSDLQAQFFDTNPVVKELISSPTSPQLQAWPDSDTKAAYFILKKENLTYLKNLEKGLIKEDETQHYIYAWSDPIPLYSYDFLKNQLNSLNNQMFFPDWWGMTYQLNPYLNFIQESASPLRNKLVFADYTTPSQVTTGATRLTALSNICRAHHMDIVCNDNGLPSIFDADLGGTPLNTLLEMQVLNPFEEDSSQSASLTHKIAGIYLQHSYVSEGETLDVIRNWTAQEKQSSKIQSSLNIKGDNRELHILDTATDPTPIYTSISYSETDLSPCLTFSRPVRQPAGDIDVRFTEYLDLAPCKKGRTLDNKTSWCWTPGQSCELLKTVTSSEEGSGGPQITYIKGFTTSLSVRFDFVLNKNIYIRADLDSAEYEDADYQAIPFTQEQQVLLEQPGLFKLWRNQTGNIEFTVNFKGPGTQTLTGLAINDQNADQVFRITASAQIYEETVESEDDETPDTTVTKAKLILVINDNYYVSSPVTLTSPNTPFPAEVEQFIRLGYTYDSSRTEIFQQYRDQFYGNLYDLRLYPISFDEFTLRLLNAGSIRELYSYGPSSYKLAYSIYKDLNILKTVTQDVDNWSIAKVRVFSRSVWDSVLTDMYPLTIMEKTTGFWQYTQNYYDPYTDSDIYKEYLNIPLDITSDQLQELIQVQTDEEKQALFQKWGLTVPNPADVTLNYEYSNCVEQTLKDRAEVINSSSPLGFPEDVTAGVQLKYRDQTYTIEENDTVSIINTTIYPVQYENWPLVSFNPETNQTPSLDVNLSTGAISNQENRGFYLPMGIESVNDVITYTADLDINFKISPSTNFASYYSKGNNIQIKFNSKLKARQAVQTCGTLSATENSSNSNHILFPLAIPRQKNIGSNQLGTLRRFYLKNFSLNAGFKHFLRARNYYTELYIPIPYSLPGQANLIEFGSRWHAIRTLKEGTYYFTCKYPLQFLPLIDKDFDAISKQSNFATNYLTVRFKVEVTGTPYIPGIEDIEIGQYKLSQVHINGSPSAKVKKYLADKIENTLANNQYNPSDNRTFPHRQITINLFAQDYSATSLNNNNPSDYSWVLIGTNAPEIKSKFPDDSVLLLNQALLDGTSTTSTATALDIPFSVPAFFQKNYNLPFFIAKEKSTGPDPSDPAADDLIWSIDPMGNTASIERLTIDSEQDYSTLRLVAGHAYKVLFDYTGRLTEVSFAENEHYSSNTIAELIAASGSSIAKISMSEFLKTTQVEEAKGYPRLVSLLSSTETLSDSSLTLNSDIIYTTDGSAFNESLITNLDISQSGYEVRLNSSSIPDFSPISTAPETMNSSLTVKKYCCGNPYALIKEKNLKLQIASATKDQLAHENINQSFTFPYVIEDYPNSNIYGLSFLTELPVLSYKTKGQVYVQETRPINERTLLNDIAQSLREKLENNLAALTETPAKLITKFSEVIPDISYPLIGYATYSYIKSVNEDLLGYQAIGRRISPKSSTPFLRSNLYTGNLFASRNLFDSTYWNYKFNVTGPSDNYFLFADSSQLITDSTWVKEKEVLEVQTYASFGTPPAGSTSTAADFTSSITLNYTPKSTKTIKDPFEVFTALRILIGTNETDLTDATATQLADFTVKALFYRTDNTLSEQVASQTLTRSTAPVGTSYWGYSTEFTPQVPTDRVSFEISWPSNIGTRVYIRFGKVSINRFQKDMRIYTGLSDSVKDSTYIDPSKEIIIKAHPIVLFKNKFNSQIITPIQFFGEDCTTDLGTLYANYVTRPITNGNLTAATFIQNNKLYQLSKYSPYSMLAKPWIRKLILKHNYYTLDSGTDLGSGFEDQPIRCSSTSAEIHSYVKELNVATGLWSLREKTDDAVDNIYELSKSSTGDGIYYSDSRDQQTTSAFFFINSTVDSAGNKNGLFLREDLWQTIDKSGTKKFVAELNSNLQIDDTVVAGSGQSRYPVIPGAATDDNYGTFSISKETLSLLTSTFNTQDFSEEANRQALTTSPVLVTNVQLLGQITGVTSGTVNQVLYEYEFLPVIYDEKDQHLSLNYFLRYLPLNSVEP